MNGVIKVKDLLTIDEDGDKALNIKNLVKILNNTIELAVSTKIKRNKINCKVKN